VKIIRFFPIPTTSDGCDWFVFVDCGKINQPYLEDVEIMEIIMILGVMWIIGWFVIPMLYGIFITLPKQYLNGEFSKPKQEDSDKSE